MWLAATISDSRGIERGKKTSGWSTEELELSVKNKPVKETYPGRDRSCKVWCHGNQEGKLFQGRRVKNYANAVERLRNISYC